MQGSILSYIYVVLICQIYWLLFLTCLEWCLVLLRRWKNLSHLAHKLPQLSQRMIASVSPSSWLWQVGLSGPPTPPPRSPLLRRSTWSLSSTQRAATAGHKCHILYLIPSSGILWSGPRRVRLRTVSPIAYCTLRKIDPVLTELALSNILKKLNNILEPILDLRYWQS